jgi:integrase
MRYDEIREHVRDHFRQLLRETQEDIASGGPMPAARLEALRASEGLAEGDPEAWAGLVSEGGSDGLLRGFCEARGIDEGALSEEHRDWLLGALQSGHRAYAREALTYSASLDQFDLRDTVPAPVTPAPAVNETDEPKCSEVTAKYLTELSHVGAHAAKTESEKQDALALMSDICEDKPVALMSKADAQRVKDVLLRLPRNRNKAAQTRGKTLAEMLEVKGVQVISARTANAYLSAMQTFFKWAVDNGYADVNIFTGTRFKGAKKSKDGERTAFSTDQLRTIYRQLTLNPDGLVNKYEHKWGTLIGMFTGMRLNEVAQLEVGDIREVNGVWCIDVTEDGDDNKRLKNASSQRRVPIHDRLLACGLLDFVEQQRASGSARLFPGLSYSKQNGYGRNVGRWFNEKFLPSLDMKHPGLVFHSLRHTMVTRLGQSDAADIKVKAIVGHAQSGVTWNTYFKDGFLPEQLRETINKFDF